MKSEVTGSGLTMLTLLNTWHHDGHRFARFSNASRQRIRHAKTELFRHLQPVLCRSCMHLKGRGGVKRAVRIIGTQANRYPWAARFDVASYYESIDHAVLRKLLAAAGANERLRRLIGEYLALPDVSRKEKGATSWQSAPSAQSTESLPS